MALTLASATALLAHAGLLREIITRDRWTLNAADIPGSDASFTAITYDTRDVVDGALLCCKGRFREEYLDDIDSHGLSAYIAETEYSDATAATGLIVNDIRKAMSLVSARFYDDPERRLTLVGITGTKGKTTTAYYLQAMLNHLSGGKAALFSSVDNCLDGHTYVESDLTTPESMDAFRMMRQAVDNGMQYLVMEVSSQAYKVDRVYGLTFDVGAFLNISPDHISPIEHPTFEDYLYCKRQIVRNSRRLVLNADCDHAELIRQDAAAFRVPVFTFALSAVTDPAALPQADVVAKPLDSAHRAYALVDASPTGSSTSESTSESSGFHLAMDGDFNYANAAAAYAMMRLAFETHARRGDTRISAEPAAASASIGAPGMTDDATPPISTALIESMASVKVAGRMEQFADPHSSTIAIVDYAHNFTSVKSLLDFVDERYGDRNPRITLVTGSAGNKAYDRRTEIVQAAEHRIAKFLFTVEDTDDEPVLDICRYMQRAITDKRVASAIIDDRAKAIEAAVQQARDSGVFNVVLIIGKGNERWIKRFGAHIPYEGDDHVVTRLFNRR